MSSADACRVLAKAHRGRDDSFINCEAHYIEMGCRHFAALGYYDWEVPTPHLCDFEMNEVCDRLTEYGFVCGYHAEKKFIFVSWGVEQ